jgi:hypothetical protein
LPASTEESSRRRAGHGHQGSSGDAWRSGARRRGALAPGLKQCC